MQVEGSLLVGLGGQDADRLRLGRDPVERTLDVRGANPVDRNALALALEQPQVEDRRGIDDLLATQHHDVVAALDVRDRQGHVIRFGVGHHTAPVIQVGRLQHLAEEPPEEEQLLVGVGGRGPAGDLAAGLLERFCSEGDRLLEGNLFQRAGAAHPRPPLALALEVRKAVAAVVAQPAIVDREILP